MFFSTYRNSKFFNAGQNILRSQSQELCPSATLAGPEAFAKDYLKRPGMSGKKIHASLAATAASLAHKNLIRSLSMSNKRTSQINPRSIQKLTRIEWDLKLANLIIDNLNEFFNPITFVIPELTKSTYFHFLLNASSAMKMSYGPRPEIKK